METQIKFRCWNKNLEHMNNVEIINFNNGSMMIYEDGMNKPTNTSVAILMQSIGMSDSEYKDLYEGDIVKSEFGDLYKIVRNGPAFFFVEIKDEFEQEYLFDEMNMQNLNLIGNIYQNPELLIK